MNADRSSSLCQFVQMPRRVGLWRHDSRKPLRGHRTDQAVLQSTGRVDYGTQRMLVAHRIDQLGQLLAIGHVTRGDTHLRAKRNKVCLQTGGAWRPLALSADQQQVGHSVMLHQVSDQQCRPRRPCRR